MIQEIKAKEAMKSSLDARIPVYSISLLDESIGFPLTLDESLIRIVNKKFIPIFDERKRSKEIFLWMQNNILYGDSKRGNVGYRNVREVMKEKEGVCGEMAYMYTILARASGLRSNYVSVRRDNMGKKVFHACSGIFLPELVLCDPAYYTYGIKHKEFSVLTDKEMLLNFLSWR